MAKTFSDILETHGSEISDPADFAALIAYHVTSIGVVAAERDALKAEVERLQKQPIHDNLFTADELRLLMKKVRFPTEEGFTHEKIARTLNCSAGFVGMVLSGARPPTKAFLHNTGFEKITMYRRRTDLSPEPTEG